MLKIQLAIYAVYGHGMSNSVLSSALKKVMDKLQHVQNAATRLVTGTGKYERGLSRLMHDDLHWLVIPQRVQYTSLL